MKLIKKFKKSKTNIISLILSKCLIFLISTNNFLEILAKMKLSMLINNFKKNCHNKIHN